MLFDHEVDVDMVKVMRKEYFGDLSVELLTLATYEPFFSDEERLTPLLMEIPSRLRQLSGILRWVSQLEKDTAASSDAFLEAAALNLPDTAREYGDIVSEQMLHAQTLTEAFYVFAFRVVDIVRRLGSYEPLLKYGVEPKGVCSVRNLLIIHPEKIKKGQVPVHSTSFNLSAEFGGKVKNKRDPNESQTPADAGLWANAEEFLAWLADWSHEMQRRMSPVPHRLLPDDRKAEQ